MKLFSRPPAPKLQTNDPRRVPLERFLAARERKRSGPTWVGPARPTFPSVDAPEVGLAAPACASPADRPTHVARPPERRDSCRLGACWVARRQECRPSMRWSATLSRFEGQRPGIRQPAVKPQETRTQNRQGLKGRDKRNRNPHANFANWRELERRPGTAGCEPLIHADFR